MLNVGIIGERGHASKILDALTESGRAAISHVYLPHRMPDADGATQSLDDLLDCDAVFIVSPSDSHFDYMQYLGKRYDGYIFCEKPPVTSLEQLEKLDVPKAKTFFNFNYRFSGLKHAVNDALASGQLGDVIHFYSVSSQGLAFKPEYETSWRADVNRHPNGVTETKAIHMIDLAINLFGDFKDVGYHSQCRSGNGSAIDTSHTTIYFQSGAVATILASYAAPLCTVVRIIGTNGIIEYSNRQITLASPRDTFDESGKFADAPLQVVRDYNLEHLDFYNESLENAVNSFLDYVEDSEIIPTELFDASMKTSRLLLGLDNAYGQDIAE